MLVNTLVLRADLRDEPTWRELLGRVRAASIACFQHAGVPFDAVSAALHPGRDLSRPPLTPVYLDVRDRAHATPDLGPGVAARWRPLDPVHVKFELELTATAGAAGWDLAASYPVALFDAGTAAGLLDAVAAAAADLSDDPDARPLGRLP
jgi:non-ribosomal peptide synthetase component F